MTLTLQTPPDYEPDISLSNLVPGYSKVHIRVNKLQALAHDAKAAHAMKAMIVGLQEEIRLLRLIVDTEPSMGESK